VTAVRTLAVWCPDWPVVAAGVPLDQPAVVVRASRIVACSPAARSEGVALHQRRREAQGRCPELVVIDHDPATDARAFEPVVAALEALTPRIEIVHPGCCVFPTRGPSRYHGGDEALAHLAAELTAGVLAGRGPAQVGVADGLFAARLAARSRRRGPAWATTPPAGSPGRLAPAGGAAAGSAAVGAGDGPRPGGRVPGPRGGERPPYGVDRPVVVEPGGSRKFLAGQSVTTLDRPDLVPLLERLGLRTLGALAALPAADLVGRFGTEGAVAHRLASGLDERPPAPAPPPVDLSVAVELDPPAERVEAAAFVARGLADELQAKLSGRGSACTQLVIGAETEHGEHHERVWRTEGRFGASSIAERVRWQIDGWLHAGVRRPNGGLTRLWLVPDEVVPAGGRQLAFTSAGPGSVDAVEAADRAARALARVQGLAGPEAAWVPEWRGGRAPGERITLVPAAAVDVTEPRPAAHGDWVTEPWPGHIPDPAPAVVHDPPVPAEVLDAFGRPVVVDGRGLVDASPATVVVGGRTGESRPAAVVAYAGPWPCDERWWDPDAHRRRARLQALTEEGTAYLLVVERGRWAVEATYD
jgi:protein ImuB